MSYKFSVSIFALLTLAGLCVAQDPRANLVGTVVDSSGATMPGAEIRATKTDTGVVARSVANQDGKFNIPFLTPGAYRVNVEKPGFKNYSPDNVELRVADTVDLTVRMEVGSARETINVHAATPLLETETSTPGQVIDGRRLLELPQKGGDAFELTHFVPGVVNMTTMRTFKPDSPEGTSQISVDGSAQYSTQFQIDGINDTVNDEDKGYPRVAYIPPTGSIAEFKMQNSPYDASAGHVLGPTVSVSTRSDSFSPIQTGFAQTTPIQASLNNGSPTLRLWRTHSRMDCSSLPERTAVSPRAWDKPFSSMIGTSSLLIRSVGRSEGNTLCLANSSWRSATSGTA